ncbi:astacin-like metalloprotease toxin 5 isoform X2 [Folsomia candida]|nr:astacin-like metalloprotease toxin 5 isoform X2 [Folsomia candida]
MFTELFRLSSVLISFMGVIGVSSNFTEKVVEAYMRVDDMIFLRPEARSGLSPEKFRWPNGIIPYTIERNLSIENSDMLHEAMETIEDNTCLEFVPRKKEKSYLLISHTQKGCYAHVGFMNRGKQKLNLGKGCWKFATVLHELIHSIGFSHEHQRNDREQFVTIRYENMKPEKKQNFKLDKEMGMNFEFDYFGLPYNYASIMHYGRTAFSNNGKSTIIPRRVWDIEDYALYDEVDEHERPIIGLNDALTWGDITMINRMYEDEC